MTSTSGPAAADLVVQACAGDGEGVGGGHRQGHADADRRRVKKSSLGIVSVVITGSHVIVYSRDADADRAFFRDVLNYPHVDAGGGWLIFKLPPAEVAVHPVEGRESHELYLMCDDVNATIDDLADHGVSCSPVSDEGWGLLTSIRLPGGGELGLYEPRHPRATEL